MSNEIVVFTHNDLDALGCMLNLEFKLPKPHKEYFHTNYGDISEKTDEIVNHIKQNNINTLFIMDVSFSDNKHHLQELYDLNINIVFIDHHLYPEGFFDCFPNMKVYHDINMCATSLAYKVFENKNENLETLSYIIETYDIWKRNRKEFYLSHMLNQYFWEKVKVKSIENLMWNFIDNNWFFPQDFKSVTSTIKEKSDNYIKDLMNKNLIFKTNQIAIMFGSEYYNFFLIDEFNDGKDACIIVNSFGIIRIRLNEYSKLTSEQKNTLRLNITGNAHIGHENAFTFKSKNGFDNIMKEVERTVREIETELAKTN